LVTLIWLLSTIGFSMNKHYCQDILQDISFFATSGACDDSENMPDKDCEDETLHFVLDSNFNIEKYITEINVPVIRLNFIDLIINPVSFTTEYSNPLKESNFLLLDQQHLYSQIQSFLC